MQAGSAEQTKTESVPSIKGRKAASGSLRGLEFDISAQASGEAGAAGLVLPEVQEAMKQVNQQSQLGGTQGSGMNGTEWLTPDLLDKISQKPQLAAMLMHPHFAKAMQLLATSPNEAMALFAANPAARQCFTELTAMLSAHFSSIGKAVDAKDVAERADRKTIADGPLALEALRKAAKRTEVKTADHCEALSKDEEARVEKVLGQPKLRELLMDPAMQRVLQECGEPSNLARYMRHPEYGPKLQLMARAGLVQFQP